MAKSKLRYSPILKTKAGDRWALDRLPSDAAEVVTPVLEFHTSNSRAIDALLEATCEDLSAIAVLANPFYFDTCWLGSDCDPTTLDGLFDALDEHSLPGVPVVRLSSSRRFRREMRRHSSRGIMLRISPDDLDDPDAIENLLEVITVEPADVDILLEYRPDSPLSLVEDVARLSGLGEWRSVTFAAGCFPSSLKHLPRGTWSAIERRDFNHWYEAVSEGALMRDVNFADFSVRDAGPPADFGAASANVRYAKETRWYARMGRLMKEGHSADIHEICRSLCEQDFYDGASFSAGDREFFDRQTPLLGPGNAQNWVQWSANHHLVFTARQIAAFA